MILWTPYRGGKYILQIWASSSQMFWRMLITCHDNFMSQRWSHPVVLAINYAFTILMGAFAEPKSYEIYLEIQISESFIFAFKGSFDAYWLLIYFLNTLVLSRPADASSYAVPILSPSSKQSSWALVEVQLLSNWMDLPKTLPRREVFQEPKIHLHPNIF